MTQDGAGEEFGTDRDGRPVHRHRLHAPGISAHVLTYGGVLQSLEVADAAGESGNVVLGLDTMGDYLTRSRFFGAVVGRYGNRIAGASFTLDGKEYRLPSNHGRNSLHGGPAGFHDRVWRVVGAAGDRIALAYRSPDGEAGYPGALDVTLCYTVSAARTHTDLCIDYRAVTDAPTHVNLTNHSYFNLRGQGDIHRHRLLLDADAYHPVDGELLPVSDTAAPVTGTPFDFTVPRSLGDALAGSHPQLAVAGGLDHCFVLGGRPGTLRSVAALWEPETERSMEMLTTEPGVQLYSGNRLTDVVHGPRSGLCLETQHFPDSPNRPAFPSTVLRPGQEYRSRTVYRFRTDGGRVAADSVRQAEPWQ
ncbi:galactose-1-epimerase [Streptomyces sp. SID4944]|nr:galactose-1-epimerase [Streptomyces sp. SID4944]